jgi:hypothetical protein
MSSRRRRILWVGKSPTSGMTGDEVFDRKTLAACRAQGCDVDVYYPVPISRLHKAAVLATRALPYQRTRFATKHNRHAIVEQSRKVDAAIYSLEPHDALVRRLSPPSILIAHNVASRALSALFPNNMLVTLAGQALLDEIAHLSSWTASAVGAAVALGAAASFALAAAAELVHDGAEAITTNCGFLSLFQAELAAHVRVPVATSALIQVLWVQAMLPPGRRVGIITVSAGSLTPRHLAAAGVPLDTPFVGTEDGREFFRVLVRGEKQDMDVALAAADILDAGRTLVSRHRDIGAIVPYAFALREALGLPVYDIYSLITWLHAGLRPRAFGPPADRATYIPPFFPVGDAS